MTGCRWPDADYTPDRYCDADARYGMECVGVDLVIPLCVPHAADARRSYDDMLTSGHLSLRTLTPGERT
jgi:hypothetical protein